MSYTPANPITYASIDQLFQVYYQWPMTSASYNSSTISIVNLNVAKITTEEILAIEKRQEEERKRVEVAASRAEELLFMCIGDERKKQYIDHKHFDAEVNGRVYRISRGRSMNVALLEDGHPKVKFCAHPDDYVPDADTMLAQFLMLTTDEQKFLSLANRSDGGVYNVGAYTPASIGLAA